MTKHKLMKLLEPLEDNALVFIRVTDSDGTHTLGITNDIGYEDVVTGEQYQNEITLLARIWEQDEEE